MAIIDRAAEHPKSSKMMNFRKTMMGAGGSRIRQTSGDHQENVFLYDTITSSVHLLSGCRKTSRSVWSDRRIYRTYPRLGRREPITEDSCEKSQLSSKSKGFGTFTAPKGDILGVGSCKFDTYGFNINNLQKQFFDFENVDIFFIYKKINFPKSFGKNLKMMILNENSK